MTRFPGIENLQFRPIADHDLVRGHRAPIRDGQGITHAAEYDGQAWVYSACPQHPIDGDALEIGEFPS